MRQEIRYTWEVRDIRPGLSVSIGRGTSTRPHVVIRKTTGADPRSSTECEAAEYWKFRCQDQNILNLACLSDGSLSHSTWINAQEMADYLTTVNAEPRR